MISFLETIKGNDPVFFIHALCGIGDITSHLARLPSVEKVYPNHKIVFLLGGYGKSPKLSKEMIERQGYAATTIKNYIVSEDCGKVINPMIVDGQVHGGVAQGIGAALLEELKYDENGQLQTATLADYIIPTPKDVPNIKIKIPKI